MIVKQFTQHLSIIMTAKDAKRVLNKVLKQRTVRFFCFSDEMSVDVKTLRMFLYDRKEKFYPLLVPKLNTWKNQSLFMVHHPSKTIQDLFDSAILESQFVVFLVESLPKENTMHEWNLCMENDSKNREIVLGIHAVNRQQIDVVHNCMNHSNRVFEYRYSTISEVGIAIADRLTSINNDIQNQLRDLCSTDIIDLLETVDFIKLVRTCHSAKLPIEALVSHRKFIDKSFSYSIDDIIMEGKCRNHSISFRPDSKDSFKRSAFSITR